MSNYAGEGRAEAASIDVRYAENRVGKEAIRPAGVAQQLAEKLSPLVERVHRVRNNLLNLGDRAYGEQPPMANRTDMEAREAPPYGGAMAEIFWTIDRLEDAISAAEHSAARIDGLA